MNRPNSQRRMHDAVTGTPSLLASGVRLIGDIETPGALIMSGHVQGNGRIAGELTVLADSQWEGDIVARSAVVAGRVLGNLVIIDKIEIAASAVIRGRLTARRIAMARGATIEGELTITGNEPILEYEEKRGEEEPGG
jgi:cytoskeletal protein CcmA (bactofilin family)